jgi:apolipoprotein D and lipocalin family protein
VSGSLLGILVLSLAPPATPGDDSPPKPVGRVDLERYVGLWYEIAKIPNRFQKQCARGTTATYELREDGRLDVVNRCVEENGEIKEAKGIAKVEDAKSNAKLKVSFVRALGVNLFWGDYWILGLGPEYEYAIVGSPDRKYGWILARSPTISPERLQGIFDQLVWHGYDPDDFEITAH